MSDYQVILLCVCVPLVLIIGPVAWMLCSVCREFKDDPSSPGIVLSYLWEKQQWYASVVRYSEKFGRGKTVVMNVYSHYLLVAIARLVLGWAGHLSVQRKNAVPVRRNRGWGALWTSDYYDEQSGNLDD